MPIVCPTIAEQSGQQRALRVALVAHDIHFGGGMERAMAELIVRSAGRVSFDVVSRTLDPELRPLVRWHRVRVPGRPFLARFPGFWLAASRIVRRLDVDLVQTCGAIVPNRVDIASVHFCHAGYVESNGRWTSAGLPAHRRAQFLLLRGVALAGERWCYRPGRVRQLAAVSRRTADEVRRHYPGIATTVVPNGVDLDRFKPDATARTVLREAQTTTDDEVVALFVGGDWERKGLPMVLQAVQRLRSRGVDLRLWVVGPGPAAAMESTAEALGIAASVAFVGSRDDVERWFSAADIFVLPSEYETFSLVTYEAAASGLPVVATLCGGIEDLIDADTGVVIDRSVAGIADALERLAVDRDERRRLGSNARARASAYDWDRSTDATVDLYRQLTAGS
jgi:glycosyltransferase involved in cell wall biosynthesis